MLDFSVFGELNKLTSNSLVKFERLLEHCKYVFLELGRLRVQTGDIA